MGVAVVVVDGIVVVLVEVVVVEVELVVVVCGGGCGRERRVWHDLEACTVDIPSQHVARITSRFKEPSVERVGAGR